MKKNEKLRWLMPVVALLALWGGVFLTSCSGDDGDGSGSSGTPPVSNTSLYRLGATEDCGFVDDVISDFGSDGAYLYYPVKLNLDTDTAEFSATVTVTNTDGYLGIGLINVKAGAVANYVFATPEKKVRYKAAVENGSGWSTTSLPNSTIAVNTPYTFKATLSGGKITFDILDASGTNVATKNNSWNSWLLNDGDVYLAIGGPSGDTATISYRDIKVKVNDGETYTINKIEDTPDKSALVLGEESVKVKKDETEQVPFTALDKSGNNTSVSVSAKPEGIVEVTADASQISIKGLKGGSATITVTNTANPELKKTCSVTVLAYTTEDTYTLNAVYPANNATSAYEDGEYMLTFDEKPTLEEGGLIEIYDATTGAAIDSIAFAKETQTLFGTEFGVEDQLVRVEGNAVYFTPHIGKIENGKTYYVVVSSGAITGKMNGKEFVGLTNNASNTQWKFTTRAKPSVGTTITVNGAQDSTANFRTIQGALNAIGTNEDRYKIEVAKGTYRELLYFNGKADVEIEGQGTETYGADVRVEFANAGTMNNDKNNNEKYRCLFEFIGGNLILENIYLKNTFLRSNKVWTTTGNTQAEVLGFDSGAGKWVAAYNCGLYSHQDTIRTVQKAWFYNCYITGDVDFIWQERTGLVQLVEKSEIVALGDDTTKAYLVAPGADPKSPAGKGSVILNATVDVQCKETYYGRSPWSNGRYNNAAIVNTTFTTSKDGKLYPCYSNRSCEDSIDDKYVGWKTYNITLPAGTTPNDNGYCVTLEEDFYKKEYSGRRAILNRVYDKDAGDFVQDTTANWKIDELIAAQSWTVDEDTSSELAEGEVAVTAVTYTFSKGTNGAVSVSSSTGDTFGIVLSGMTSWNGDQHYGNISAGGYYQLAVTGSCVIEFNKCAYSKGNLTVTYGSNGTENTLLTVSAGGSADNEGAKFYYNGEATKIRMTFDATAYTHGQLAIKYSDASIVNEVTDVVIGGGASVAAGSEIDLTATVVTKYLNPLDSTVTWTSSDSSVATVSSDGKVTGVGAGSTTITVTANGIKAEKNITVTAGEITADPGKTYSYDLTTTEFKDKIGSSEDGLLSWNATGTQNHGIQFASGNTMTLIVAGSVDIALTCCQYANAGMVSITDADGNQVATDVSVSNKGTDGGDGTCTTAKTISYTGNKATKLTFTFKNTAYIHAIEVKPAASN
ncbi:MAG: Ig-like domain-containing protein [Treponemataceae bacterium]|nr:Ig-like domain-containing protein [Treponemataceae bacterium]